MSVRIRSTLIASSRAGLFKLGHREAYEAALGPGAAAHLRDASMIAQWLPMDDAVSHYGAADAIGLSDSQMLEVGDVVGARLEGALWGSVARTARRAGFTPWTTLRRLDRIWGRMYDGDRVEVTQAGPKDAVIHIRDNPLCDILYWRVALSGLMKGTTEIFARSAFVNVRAEGPGHARFDVAWA